MRITMTAILAAFTAVFATSAFAELQNVEVGGSIRIRGSWFSSEATASRGTGNAINPFDPPRPAALFVEEGDSNGFVEQRTTVSVKADFTNDVTAFIELDAWDIWGTDFRDDYAGGAANFAPSDLSNDVSVYQAYIEMREAWGYPVTVRIGRQEMMFGSEWLIGNNDTAAFFTGLSFDGISARYDAETWNVTAFWSKLVETGTAEEDGDTDLYGIYASYTGFEDITLDAYWLFLRDGAAPAKTTGVGPFNLDIIENLFGVDQFQDTQTIHTFGLRGAGTFGNFDFEAEVAYQTGSANLISAGFFPAAGSVFAFAEDDAEYDNIGANVEVGYTFDVAWTPRVYLGAAYFEGEDDRENTFAEFIRSIFPFGEDDSSISFNRLFSDWEYSEFLANTDLSNAIVFRGGIGASPTENIDLLLAVSYFLADEVTRSNGLLGVPFWGRESDDNIGWEVGLYADYAYSEDLSFSVGYAHFFAGDGVDNNDGFLGPLTPLTGGNFIGVNGLGRVGGVSDDDADYVFFETKISF